MKFKASEYNFIYDDLGKDQIVMYNSLTGALAVAQETQYKQFISYLRTGKEEQLHDNMTIVFYEKKFQKTQL